MKNCLEITRWNTRATKYPLMKYKSAELIRTHQSQGFYRMEGVDGYALYHHEKPILITALKINDKVWMIDDPLHYVGMRLLAKKAKGNVVFAGLGLGLIVPFLLRNREVKSITAVEINSDVINMIRPLLPRSKRMRFVNDDIFKYESKQPVDTIILDIWVGNGTDEMKGEMLSAFGALKLKYQNALVYIWGYGAYWLNPSVDNETRRKMVEMGLMK